MSNESGMRRCNPLINLQPDAPQDDGTQNGSGHGVCGSCGTTYEHGVNKCPNPTCRRWVRANQGARGLGLRAHQHPVELRMVADDLMAGITVDRGGAADLTTLERSYIQKTGSLEICLHILVNDIATNGLLTPGGKVRDVYDKLLAGLDRFDRYAQRIGIERKAKRVDLARVLSGLDRA